MKTILYSGNTPMDKNVIKLDGFFPFPIIALDQYIQNYIKQYSESSFVMIKGDITFITIFVNGNIPRFLYFNVE